MTELIKKVLIIYGPTVTGKTALALQLARKFNGELISADSRQVYKGLDIGTGKLSIEQLNESTIKRLKDCWIVDKIKIYGFDLVKPGENFSVAEFIKFAQGSISRIIKEKKMPIIVGGTGFYLGALIKGLDTQGIPANQKLRQELEKLDRVELYNYLIKINPSKAKSMNNSDRQNPRRLIRAIEVSQSTIIDQRSTINNHRSTINNLIIGLSAPNEFLFNKADNWLETRIAHELVEEVQKILDQKVDPIWLDNLGLEYRWICRYLTGKIKKDQAIARLKGDIHSLIRRQKTWFSKFENLKIFDITQADWQTELEKTIDHWYTHM